MVIDKLENSDRYVAMHPLFKQAFDFLRDEKTATLPPGKYELNGDKMFANIQEYPTRIPEKCSLELHRKYIDIQFLFFGNEAIGYAAKSNELVETQPYSEENDIQFFKGCGTPIPFEKNTFFILFPSDAHAPGIITEPQNVKKVIIKIADE